MSVKCIITGLLQANTYILDDGFGEAIIIDPGDEAKKIIAYLENNKLKLMAILLTHAHADHIGAVIELKSKYNIPIMIHKNEIQILENPEFNLSAYFSKSPYTFLPDKIFTANDVYSFGNNINIYVLYTPGHTPGGVCYYLPESEILFSGDTLFYQSIGRTDFIFGNFNDIQKSIKEKLFTLPENTRVYPGHGISTTIYNEKKNNQSVYDDDDWE